MTQKRKWSAAAKFEIALLALKGETTINEICTKYQVAPCQVHSWKKQLLEDGAQIFGKADKTAVIAAADNERVQRQLYEKIGQLTVERDFLKKGLNKFHGNGDES